MKLNKFNKRLKDEFNDTIEDKIVVKETKKAFHFKFRYVLLSLAAILIVFLVTDHIMIQNYNSKAIAARSNYENVELSTQKYDSEEKLNSALVYTYNYEKKLSTLDRIGSMFSLLQGCSSRTRYAESKDETQVPGGSAIPGGSNNSSYNTNVQENGIDEADVAKCDGTYIYSLSNDYLNIYSLEGDLVLQKEIYAKDMYVKDDKLVLFSTRNMEIFTFDGNNITSNKKLDKEIVETRLFDNYLYAVTIEGLDTSNVNYSNAYYDGSVNPYALYRIYKINLDNLDDIKEADLASSTRSMIYMSDNYFCFITTNDFYSYPTCTNIFILDLNLEGYAAIKEKGYALNKYSFSEYDGMLRYVLTDIASSNPIHNSIYVYDLEKKELKGSLENKIGLNYELVKSVRFEKNLCYVCTYRNTDPLYLIDLSDPSNIKIESELHVSGYSGYLHNFIIDGTTYTLGVGYNDSRLPKVSLYKEEDGDLVQVGKSLVLTLSANQVLFDENGYLIQDLKYYNYIALVNSYIGYFFYINPLEPETIYFGAPAADHTYLIFKIDTAKEEPISVYKEHTYTQKTYYAYLRCFLVNGKLYYVGDGTISIEEF